VNPKLVANEIKTGAIGLSEDELISYYNEAQRALGEIVRHISPDPACSPQLIAAMDIWANDYNPNKVASVELDLLENSMRADGITMAVVVIRDGDRATVVDGFHRRMVGSERLGRKYLPCSVIDRPLVDRMASTVRHNRARGKHHVDLMADLVKGMMALGWEDEQIAENLGMSVEELLRLRQMVGAARMMAGEQYTREWGVIENAPEERSDEE
jgi:ParB-like chromosome segregation protein Spo0J